MSDTRPMLSVPTHLTVLMRDSSPLIHMGEPVSHRRVTIALTEEQRAALTPMKTGRSSGTDIYEEPSISFLESIKP